SQSCVLGGDPANPTATPSCGGLQNGVCLYRPQGNGAGDFGYCAPVCAKHDDCQNPGFWCKPIVGLTGTMGFTDGYSAVGFPCPTGASDCTMVTGSTCTDTRYGPICLVGNFPLGSAAPCNDGGTEGGTDDAGTGCGPLDGGGTGGGGTGGSGTGGSGTGGSGT